LVVEPEVFNILLKFGVLLSQKTDRSILVGQFGFQEIHLLKLQKLLPKAYF
jgi:hypothetical protein